MCFADRRNRMLINILLFILFLNIFLNFISPFIQIFMGVSSTSNITLVIYTITLLVCLYRIIQYRLFTINKVLFYISIMIFFMFHYFLFANSRLYLLSDNMILIYVFFLPLCIFMVSSIKEWDEFIKISYKYSVWAIILSMFILTLGLNRSLNYMEFSYGLLPFLCFLLFNCLENYRITKLLYLVVGVIVLLLFGARSPLLFLIVLLLYWMITNLSRIKGIFVTIVVGLCLFLVSLNMEFIFRYLSGVNSKMNSYVLSNLLAGEFFSSSSRIHIYEESRAIIGNMGLSMYGLFGDRNMSSGVYSHNIIYEILISFGWFFGVIVLTALLTIILKAYFSSSKNGKLLVVTFSLALFARYFISGSFVMEQMFYIYVAIMISIIIGNKKKRVV